MQFNIWLKITDTLSVDIWSSLSVYIPPVLNAIMEIPTASVPQNSNCCFLNCFSLSCCSLEISSRQKARENVMLACLIYFPHLKDCYPLLLIGLCLISNVLHGLSSILVLNGMRANMSSNYSTLTQSRISMVAFSTGGIYTERELQRSAEKVSP